MRRRDALIGAGGAAFVAGFVALMPARVALGLVAADARVSGASGTIWSGTADALQMGNVRLGRTEWSLHLTSLLAARLGADVATQWSGGRGRGFLAVGVGGALACEECEISADVAMLRTLAPVPALAGNLDLAIQTLEVKDGWPRRAVGSARVREMPLTVPGQSRATGATGSFEISFNADPVPEGGLIEGVVTDIGGPLQVTARLQLMPPGSYQLAGTAQARPDAPTALTSNLPLLGPQRADGSHEFAFSGTF